VLCESDTINRMFVFTHTIYKSKICRDLLRSPINWTDINSMAT